MFKVPEWQDVPKSTVNLKKKINSKKQHKNDIKLVPPNKAKKVVTPAKQEPEVNDNKSQGKKRKHNGQIKNNKKKKTNNNSTDISNVDTDNADELLLDAKKKKFYEPIERDDIEDQLFQEATSKKDETKNRKYKQVTALENEKPKKVFQVQDTNTSDSNSSQQVNRKKEKLKAMLETHTTRNSITVTGSKLRDRMMDRLKAAQFRYLNEKLYTSSGTEAKELFQSDPAAFRTYHQGYQQQLKKWPVNPLDVIVKRIQKMPKSHTIADMGCGEAALSKRIPHKVRSFDLVSAAPGVETCDMAHTPLLAASVDAAVYCLALMGTELTQYLVEANRVLKMGGHLLIAEVESRFDDVDAFPKEVMKLGFKLKKLDKQHKVFFFMEFVKIRDPPAKKSRLPMLTLKPCLYKKR